ncbi:type III secretion system inner membrane R protein [Pirellula staleyi DSM 6068]|uniref:Type III secretion system inner membrane R protein n=1 Tax=Pirellula staleyi (strain ATCC 27377 / DSM 6068 / ICPB 4128) TaxID=530564 RepID=D2R542_PIRSD|nr:flagellar biosynthetic protein FliR [Pirellula staleyi]ADB19004.1 type III secretion system inner membrane R protein [Pirellula staleyi DSM 6068]
MSPLITSQLDQIVIFSLVLTRIGMLVFILPMFGSSSVPMQARAILAIAIALILTPVYAGALPSPPENLMMLGLMLARESMLGLALGLAVMILLAGMQLAGSIISQMSGMTLADVANPTFDTSVPIFSQLLEMLSLAIFFSLGGHRLVMSALLDTFKFMPPGQATFPEEAVEMLATIFTHSFEIGIRAAAPAIISLLLAILVVALISRTLPQLNSVAVGLNFNAMIVLAILALSLGSAAMVFQEELEPTIVSITQSILIPSDSQVASETADLRVYPSE